MKKLFDREIAIRTDFLTNKLGSNQQIKLSVLRLDCIHPIISGNKLFKLHDFFDPKNNTPNSTVITFGGAYSNHLVATAFYCKEKHVGCVGVVRGEKPAVLSQTLQQCQLYGMQLQFISREAYKQKEKHPLIKEIIAAYKNCIIIPEGGYSPKGATGASKINNWIGKGSTHICTAVGTATTIAGLALASADSQQIIGISVLKGMKDWEQRIEFLTGNSSLIKKIKFIDGYDFGGYAKYSSALISFMNNCYEQFNIPTDFVYTAKMMFAVFDMINNNYFEPGSNIVCIHTGGLQGNLSLPSGTLTFE